MLGYVAKLVQFQFKILIKRPESCDLYRHISINDQRNQTTEAQICLMTDYAIHLRINLIHALLHYGKIKL